MPITSDTLAIVAATAIGPVAAVVVTFLRDGRKAKRDRRFYVFRTLMATRRQAISNEHVGAINLIEVEFYRCHKVEKAWADYKVHLNDAAWADQAAWQEKRDKLLAKMLSEMAKVLGFRYDTLEIYQGGYAPQGWAHRDARSVGVLEFLHQLSEGAKAVPIWIVGQSPPPPPTASGK